MAGLGKRARGTPQAASHVKDQAPCRKRRASQEVEGRSSPAHVELIASGQVCGGEGAEVVAVELEGAGYLLEQPAFGPCGFMRLRHGGF